MKIFMSNLFLLIFTLLISESGMPALLRFPQVLRKLSYELQSSIGYLYVYYFHLVAYQY
jgi:hypothetical protein